MLDKSIPYYNLIMKRSRGTNVPEAELPEGYTFVMYDKGDKQSWAEIEYSVGEFDTTTGALQYFEEEYAPFADALKHRMLFIQNAEGEKVATLTNWWNFTGERRDASINWVGVKPAYQGLGLGKAIVFEGIARMMKMETERDIFLHTQTWSYKAVNIYLEAGFEFVTSGSFGGYSNDYQKAMQALKGKLRVLPKL